MDASIVCDYIEDMIARLQTRPQMYAALAGELDGISWTLHNIWSVAADRVKEYQDVRTKAQESLNIGASSYLSDDERIEKVWLGRNATTKVLAFWAKIDATLRIEGDPGP